MFRAAYSAPFSSADVNTVTKTSSPQTSPTVPMMCEDGRPFLTDPATGRRLCACHFAPEGAHSHLHGGGALPGGLKSLAVPPSSAAPHGLDGTGYYNPLLRGFPVRPERLAQCLTPSGPPIAFDPAIAAHPYGLLYAGLDVNGLGMRKAATRETTGPLKAWLHEHRKNPYPTKAEKIMLAIITKMTLTQVSTWFANARRRLKKESRLYTGRDNENDNDDPDDDVHGKDDDDHDTEGTRPSREHCDSDEDINVDVSDVSDTEDTPTISPSNTTPTSSTPSSAASPGTKPNLHSSSSSSGLAPYSTTTPPFHHPSFIPRPGPIPEYPVPGLARIGALHSLSNGLTHHRKSPALSRDSTVPGGAKTSPASSSSQGSTLPSSSSNGSSSPVSAPATKPKIWSISEIIHSDQSSPSSSTASAHIVSSSSGSEGEQLLNAATDKVFINSRDVTPSAQMMALQQRHDFLQHRLTSPFRTLEPSEVRLASRHASAFLGVPIPGTHPAWAMAPSVGARLASPCHMVKLANGNMNGGEYSTDAEGSPGSEDDGRNCSPQTEALDLHTKKEETDKSTVCT